MKFNINATALKKNLAIFAAKLPNTMEAALEDAAKMGTSLAKTNTYYISRGPNGLRDKTVWERQSSTKYTITANTFYAGFVNNGTVPHTIKIKNASVLTNGTDFFGKEVHHPGTHPYPFMSDTLTFEQHYLGEAVERHLTNLLHRL